MKKFFIMFCLLLLIAPTPNNAVYAEITNVKVIYSCINVYSEPNHNSLVITQAKYGNVFTLSQPTPIDGQNNISYYKIILDQINQSYGYVICSQVLDVALNSPQKYLDQNATIKKDAITYEQPNKDFPNGITLKRGQKIKILDAYDSKSQFTRIQFKNEQGEIVTTYVETTLIKTSGISSGTVSAIILIVSTVSLVLIVFGITHKKKKTKKIKTLQ